MMFLRPELEKDPWAMTNKNITVMMFLDLRAACATVHLSKFRNKLYYPPTLFKSAAPVCCCQ